jgi:hypothetical protein
MELHHRILGPRAWGDSFPTAAVASFRQPLEPWKGRKSPITSTTTAARATRATAAIFQPWSPNRIQRILSWRVYEPAKLPTIWWILEPHTHGPTANGNVGRPCNATTYLPSTSTETTSMHGRQHGGRRPSSIITQGDTYLTHMAPLLLASLVHCKERGTTSLIPHHEGTLPLPSA